MEGPEPVSGPESEGVRQPVLVEDAFTRWVYGRPFFGGLWLTLGGAWILLTMKASVKVVLHVGMQGVAGYLLPTLMVLLGLLILFSPEQRLFYSITGVLISMATWVTSNLGGFMVGLLLGVAGSVLTFGWLPDQHRRVSRHERREQGGEAERPGTESLPGQAGPATDTAHAGMVAGTPQATQ
ncbi:Integral membrane protein OS=Streptomyces canus OX=58343 GN=AQI96_01690 PE=4 SV=1 [Streptomyces canus]